MSHGKFYVKKNESKRSWPRMGNKEFNKIENIYIYLYKFICNLHIILLYLSHIITYICMYMCTHMYTCNWSENSLEGENHLLLNECV